MDDDLKAAISGAGAVHGPELRMTAQDIIEHGTKVRLRRKRWAVAGTTATTAAAIIAVAVVFTQSPVTPVPVQPAGPGLSTTSVPPSPSEAPGPDVTTPERQTSKPSPSAGRPGGPVGPSRTTTSTPKRTTEATNVLPTPNTGEAPSATTTKPTRPGPG